MHMHLSLSCLGQGRIDLLHASYFDFFLSVFAGAETLFYHAKHARSSKKSLSLDEIQSLLITATSLATPPHEEEPGKPHPPISNSSSDAGAQPKTTKKLSFQLDNGLGPRDDGLSSQAAIPVKNEAEIEIEEVDSSPAKVGLSPTEVATPPAEVDQPIGEVILKEEWMTATDVRITFLAEL